MLDTKKNSSSKFDPLPEYQYGVWRQHIAQRSEGKVPLKSYVQGTNRYKFFNCPLKIVEKHHEQPEFPVEVADYWSCLQEPGSPTRVTVSTQTDYRENDAQTDPWDPPYRIKDVSTGPQVLLAASLHFGEGLPAHAAEVDDIARAKEKCEWAASLPPLNADEALQEKRHQMIIEQRIKEMDFTKQKIKEKHERKLAQKQSALIREYQERSSQKERLLDNMWSSKKSELAQKTTVLREKFLRSMQRLDRKRSILTKKYDPHVLVPDDSAKAVLSDNAIIQSKIKRPVDVRPEHFYLDSVQGLVELERWLWEEQRIVMEPEIYLPKKDPHPTHVQQIIEQQMQRDYTERKADKGVADLIGKTHLTERSRPRPLTPSVPPVSEDVLSRTCAAVILQRTLRGRALQKEVLEIRNKYIDVISELRKTHAVTTDKQSLLNEKKKEKLLYYYDQRVAANEVNTKEEILSRFEGKTISDILNFMGKAGDRYKQYLKVNDLVLQANEERRRREAIEAGHRQQELTQHGILDEVLKEIHMEREVVINEFLDGLIAEENGVLIAEGDSGLIAEEDGGLIAEEDSGLIAEDT